MDETAFQALVVKYQDSVDKRLEGIEEQLVLARIDIATLKIKAGMWGALAGLVPAAIGSLAIFAGLR